MTETTNLQLPLVAAAQAQKHVTVNEALARLDAAVQISVITRFETDPPALPMEGDSYMVANGAVNAWEGRAGQIASYLNGGWIFLVPQLGWQAFLRDEFKRVIYDGAIWVDDVLAISPGGAVSGAEVIENDFTLIGGTSLEETGFLIPPNTCAFAVTGRVLTALSGSLTSWSLGVDGSEARYGSGLGLGEGSYILGLTGQPLTYYQPTKLRLTADGGDFSGGTIRFAVHLLRFVPPDPLS